MSLTDSEDTSQTTKILDYFEPTRKSTMILMMLMMVDDDGGLYHTDDAYDGQDHESRSWVKIMIDDAYDGQHHAWWWSRYISVCLSTSFWPYISRDRCEKDRLMMVMMVKIYIISFIRNHHQMMLMMVKINIRMPVDLELPEDTHRPTKILDFFYTRGGHHHKYVGNGLEQSLGSWVIKLRFQNQTKKERQKVLRVWRANIMCSRDHKTRWA